jgi:hypothetical protein
LYPARLVQVVDLGVQPRSYKGEEKDPQPMILLTYELVGEFLVDESGEPDPGKPRWVSESFPLYGLKAEKAKSNQRLAVLDPQGVVGGNFAKLLGTPCMINIVQQAGKKDPTAIYAKIDALAVMRAKDRIGLADLVNEPRVLDLDEPNKAVFDELPEWVQEKIRTSIEFKGSKAEAVFGGTAQKAEAKAKPNAKEAGDGNPY